MRILLPSLFGVALFCATEVRAQALPMIEFEPGTPLVRDPVILIPAHDPDRELVLYRVLDFNLDAADLPFFIDRTGLVVLREHAEATIDTLLSEERTAVYSCSFRSGESPNIAQPAERSRSCTLRRQL